MRSKKAVASLINITLISQFGTLLTTLSSATASTISNALNAIFTMITTNCMYSTLITALITTNFAASILVLLNKLFYTLRYMVVCKTKITKSNSHLGSSRAIVSLSTIQTAESLQKKRDNKHAQDALCICTVDLKSGTLGLDSLCVP